MPISIRSILRRALGVRRTPTYYLPVLTRPGLECVLIISNVEARFRPGFNQGPFPVSLVQYDAEGAQVRRNDFSLRDSTDAVEVRPEPAAGGCGFVTVSGERIDSDLYVTLSDGEAYTATHGRGEFVETYPLWTRALMTILGGALALAGRTIPAFTRNQYIYVGADSRSHLLLMNLSNVTNRIRVAASRDRTQFGARLVGLRPMGSHLLDVTTLVPATGKEPTVYRFRLEGNAWFNLYLVAAGSRDLGGPLSLMHVK